MPTIEQVLGDLVPAVTHELARHGVLVSLLLLDSSSPAVAQRTFAIHQLNSREAFRAVVLSVVNELRLKSCSVALEELAEWD